MRSRDTEIRIHAALMKLEEVSGMDSNHCNVKGNCPYGGYQSSSEEEVVHSALGGRFQDVGNFQDVVLKEEQVFGRCLERVLWTQGRMWLEPGGYFSFLVMAETFPGQECLRRYRLEWAASGYMLRDLVDHLKVSPKANGSHW